MTFLWTYGLDALDAWISRYTNDPEMEFLSQLDQAAIGFLVGEGNPLNMTGVSYYSTGILDKKNETMAKHLDFALLGKEYEPSWGFEGGSRWTIEIDLDAVEKSVRILKTSGDFFYLHVLCMTFFGGIENQYQVNKAIEENEELLEDIYLRYKAFVTAKKMEREFSKLDVLNARKVYKSISPISTEDIPPYALHSSSVFEAEGNYYLTYDAIKAISAAGGLAQALERQDLEGGVTNAAKKQDRTRRIDSRTTEDDKGDGVDEEDSK